MKVWSFEGWFSEFLAQSNPQESVNLQSIKNSIHNLIFSSYAQDSRSVISWRVGGIGLQVLGENPSVPHKFVPASSLMNVTFILLSLFLRSILRLMIFHDLKNILLVDHIFRNLGVYI